MDCPWCGAEGVTEEHIETCPKRPTWDVLSAWRWICGWWKENEEERAPETPVEEEKVSP